MKKEDCFSGNPPFRNVRRGGELFQLRRVGGHLFVDGDHLAERSLAAFEFVHEDTLVTGLHQRLVQRGPVGPPLARKPVAFIDPVVIRDVKGRDPVAARLDEVCLLYTSPSPRD